jgi:hypothetical protein
MLLLADPPTGRISTTSNQRTQRAMDTVLTRSDDVFLRFYSVLLNKLVNLKYLETKVLNQSFANGERNYRLRSKYVWFLSLCSEEGHAVA